MPPDEPGCSFPLTAVKREVGDSSPPGSAVVAIWRVERASPAKLAVTKVVPNISLAKLTRPKLPSGLLWVAVLAVVLD